MPASGKPVPADSEIPAIGGLAQVSGIRGGERRLLPWLWPVVCFVTLAGYFAPWVDHGVSGLVITGLDLGEYVKFLPGIRDGSISVWRQGFYLPLLAVSLSCSFTAYRPVFGYSLPARLSLLLLGLVAALNMLPPAWSPTVLASSEFRLQTIWIALSLVALAFSPFLALVPSYLAYTVIAVVSVTGLWFCLSGFMRVIPGIFALYQSQIVIGWGPYAFAIGLGLQILTCLLAARIELRQPIHSHAPYEE